VTGAASGSHARVAAHAGITFAGLLAANVLNYLFYALVSRALGVEPYGAFSSLVALVLIVSGPALIGQMVVAKLASDFAATPDRLSGLVRAVDRVTMLVAALPALALALAAVPLSRFFRLDDPPLIVLAACSLCGALALPLLRGVLQGTSGFGAFALSNVAEGFGKALCATAGAYAGGLRGALAGMAVGYGGAALWTFAAGRPHGRAAPAHLALGRVVRASLPVALAVFCINVMLLYDAVLAKSYLDPRTAGLYGAAALAGRALYAGLTFVPTVLLPQAAGRAARGQRTRVLFFQALGVTVLACAAGAAVFGLAPRLVVSVIAGRSFGDAAAFAFPYVLAVSALATANVVATYNIARGRTRFVVPLACVAAGEILTVVLRHRSAADLLQTIAVGHTLGLLACATSLGGRTQTGAESARK
jgi:O-antigen/teichoic acid export membrane protein